METDSIAAPYLQRHREVYVLFLSVLMESLLAGLEAGFYFLLSFIKNDFSRFHRPLNSVRFPGASGMLEHFISPYADDVTFSVSLTTGRTPRLPKLSS